MEIDPPRQVERSSRQSSLHGEITNAQSSPLSPFLYYSESTSSLDKSLVEGSSCGLTTSGASLLANDLSDLVSLNLHELTSIAEPSISHSSIPDGITLNNPPLINEKTFQSDIPISYISLTGQNHFYMKEFYNDFSNIILPFQANADGTSINPVRDVLMICARDSYYLLYALLACGARTSHRKTSLPEDQSNYKLYLRHCLESLTTAMDQDMTAKLDSILLTILVLTCDNASNKSQAWRAHLRGAKDLLLNQSADSHKCRSLTFLLCRSWYSSIEILAGLVSPNGGTLKSSGELDLLILPNVAEDIDALRKLKLISPEGFSLFHGYSTELVVILKDLIGLLHRDGKCRKRYRTIIDLISRVEKQLEFHVIDKTGIIPETHQHHPDNVISDQLDLPKNIGVVSIEGRKIAFSWLDISHRSYALAALITIFTKLLNMNEETEIVQEMVRDLLDTALFLDGTKDSPKSYCPFLLQWPMLVAGFNSIREEDKVKVETFFRLLAELGSGSAGFVLAKMRKIWLGGSSSEGETPDEVDLVTY